MNAKSPGNQFKDYLTRVRHERDAAVVSALRLVALLMKYGNDRVFPLLLWDFPLAPDEGVKSMELQQDGPVSLKSEFQQFHGKAVRPHCFRVCTAFSAVAISSSVGSIPRALATGCCGSLFGMSGLGMSDLAFSSEWKNRTHLSRIRALSRSSLPSSSGTHWDSTFFVSSSCNDLMFWKIPYWSPMRNCFVQLTSSRVRLGQSFKTVGYGSASCWGDLGAGSVEADVFYIPFIVSVQYIGY